MPYPFVLSGVATRLKEAASEDLRKAGAPFKIHCVHSPQSMVSNEPSAKKN
jgi:hypothetical protein